MYQKCKQYVKNQRVQITCEQTGDQKKIKCKQTLSKVVLRLKQAVDYN